MAEVHAIGEHVVGRHAHKGLAGTVGLDPAIEMVVGKRMMDELGHDRSGAEVPHSAEEEEAGDLEEVRVRNDTGKVQHSDGRRGLGVRSGEEADDVAAQ